MQQSADSLNKGLCKFQLWSYDQTFYHQKQLFLPACILLEFLPEMQLPVLTKSTLILSFVWTGMRYAPQSKACSYFFILDTSHWGIWVLLPLLWWYEFHRSTRKHKIALIPALTRGVWFAPDATSVHPKPRLPRACQVLQNKSGNHEDALKNGDYGSPLSPLSFLDKVKAFHSWAWPSNSVGGTGVISPSILRAMPSHLMLG